MDKYVNEKLGESGLLMVDFNPTSMGDFESNQLKNERGYTFTKDMNDSLVISIYNWKFTKGSTILDKKITIPKKKYFSISPGNRKRKKYRSYQNEKRLSNWYFNQYRHPKNCWDWGKSYWDSKIVHKDFEVSSFKEFVKKLIRRLKH